MLDETFKPARVLPESYRCLQVRVIDPDTDQPAILDIQVRFSQGKWYNKLTGSIILEQIIGWRDFSFANKRGAAPRGPTKPLDHALELLIDRRTAKPKQIKRTLLGVKISSELTAHVRRTLLKNLRPN